MPKVKEIRLNKIPRWRLIKRYDNSDKVDKFVFSSLYEISDFLQEPLQNVAKYTCNNSYAVKKAYAGTMKRWKNIHIEKVKYKKMVTFVIDE
jgi:hypothetical protein